MDVGIIGFGNQGKKRAKYLDNKTIKFIFDKNKNFSNFNRLEQLPLEKISAVFLCVPDNVKVKLIKYFLRRKKHILVEKPLLLKKNNLVEIVKLQKKKYLVYTAYNHRFEPNIIDLKKKIDKKIIGKVYYIKIYYGNGTSLLVKKSPWKDKSDGVVTDLGSHIIDLLIFLFPEKKFSFELVSKLSFENKSYDHVLFRSLNTNIKVFCEATFLSWKNNFYIDVIGEKGSLHVNGLCKWGAAYSICRIRKYPSGVPKENIKKIVSSDLTWIKEHQYFKKILNSSENKNFLKKDTYISNELKKLINRK